MAKKQKEKECPAGAPLWMTTYGDMVTLLLTFFVMMLSFANLDEVKFYAAKTSLQGALGVLKNAQSMKSSPNSTVSANRNMAQTLGVIDQLKQEFENQNISNQVEIEFNENGMLLKLEDEMLFDSGSDLIKNNSHKTLKAIGKAFARAAKEVIISGHTDDRPISNEEFPSNWELSTARALAVVNYLIGNSPIEPKVLVAAGYGKYRPLLPNDSEENRQKNRRVEFLVTWK